MLILTRKLQESVVVGRSDNGAPRLRVIVLEISATRVKLGFDVEDDVVVHRAEMWARRPAGGQPGSSMNRGTAAQQERDRWDDDGGAESVVAQGTEDLPGVSAHERGARDGPVRCHVVRPLAPTDRVAGLEEGGGLEVAPRVQRM